MMMQNVPAVDGRLTAGVGQRWHGDAYWRAADVNAAAQGMQIGNALNWHRIPTLELSGMSLDAHFDD